MSAEQKEFVLFYTKRKQLRQLTVKDPKKNKAATRDYSLKFIEILNISS